MLDKLLSDGNVEIRLILSFKSIPQCNDILYNIFAVDTQYHYKLGVLHLDRVVSFNVYAVWAGVWR